MYDKKNIGKSRKMTLHRLNDYLWPCKRKERTTARMRSHTLLMLGSDYIQILNPRVIYNMLSELQSAARVDTKC